MKTLLNVLDKVTKNETISMYIIVSAALCTLSVVAPIIIDSVIDLLK